MGSLGCDFAHACINCPFEGLRANSVFAMLRVLGRVAARSCSAQLLVCYASTLSSRLASSGLDLAQERDKVAVVELPDAGPCSNCAKHVEHAAHLWGCAHCRAVRCPSCRDKTATACPACGAPETVSQHLVAPLSLSHCRVRFSACPRWRRRAAASTRCSCRPRTCRTRCLFASLRTPLAVPVSGQFAPYRVNLTRVPCSGGSVSARKSQRR